MKKFMSLLLALILTATLFAGCGGPGNTNQSYKDDPNEVVTLTIAIPFMEQKDTMTVVAEINKKLEALLPNTKIELLLESNMADKWSLWMSTQKPIDIAHSGYATDLEEEVRKDTYLQLNELVDQYAPNIKKLSQEFWYSYDNASVNGALYAIPNTQYYTKETTTIRMPEDIAKHIDTTAMTAATYASKKTPTEFYDIFTAGMEKAEAAGADCKNVIDTLSVYDVAKRGYIFIGGEMSNLCYAEDDAQCKIIDFYATKEFAEYCRYAQIWGQKGWVSKDILTGAVNTKINVHTSYRYGIDPETRRIAPLSEDAQATAEYDLNNPETQTLTTNIGENRTYYSIPFTAAHPARAMKFLDLLNSDAGSEIANLLAFGFEGKHYEYTNKETGDIRAFEYEGQGYGDVSYGIPVWMAVNMFYANSVAPYSSDFKEYGKDYYLNRLNTLEKHPLYGYTFDTTAIRTKMNNIFKNNNEYAESLYCGVVTQTDALLAQLNDKNKTAGIDAVIAELQKQANDYISSK